MCTRDLSRLSRTSLIFFKWGNEHTHVYVSDNLKQEHVKQHDRLMKWVLPNPNVRHCIHKTKKLKLLMLAESHVQTHHDNEADHCAPSRQLPVTTANK